MIRMILDVMLINGSFHYNRPPIFGNDKARRITHSSLIKELRNVSKNMEPI